MISFFDLSSGRMGEFLRLDGPHDPWGIEISPQEEWILFNGNPLPESELMLVENPR